MNEQHEQFRFVYIVLAAVAGAVTSLSFLSWKSMRWSEIGMTLFVGSAFAIFGVPWVAADFMHVDIENLRAVCGLTYFGATGANVFIPLVIRKLRSTLGSEDGA